MAEFTLPKNSKVTAGKHHAAKAGADLLEEWSRGPTDTIQRTGLVALQYIEERGAVSH